MGRKSQLKNLGKGFSDRVKDAINDPFNPARQVWNKATMTGAALKLWRQLAPLEGHLEKDNCKPCREHFAAMKTCQYILDLPEGSHNEANQHLATAPCCKPHLEAIINCPTFKGRKG